MYHQESKHTQEHHNISPRLSEGVGDSAFYNLNKRELETELLPKSCLICYDEISKEEDLIVLACGHTYCDVCLKEYISF